MINMKTDEFDERDLFIRVTTFAIRVMIGTFIGFFLSRII